MWWWCAWFGVMALAADPDPPPEMEAGPGSETEAAAPADGAITPEERVVTPPEAEPTTTWVSPSPLLPPFDPATATLRDPVPTPTLSTVGRPPVPGRGLVIAGTSTLAAGWFLAAFVAAGERAFSSNRQLEAMWIPVAGPFVQAGRTHGAFAPLGITVLVLDGLVQVTGLSLLVASPFVAAKQRREARADLVVHGVDVVPLQDGAALAVRGSF